MVTVLVGINIAVIRSGRGLPVHQFGIDLEDNGICLGRRAVESQLGRQDRPSPVELVLLNVDKGNIGALPVKDGNRRMPCIEIDG
jgi:hypothetical protein